MSELKWEELSDSQRQLLRQRENPENKPTGHFTGRCKQCGSTDLWDDCTAYGCNRCGALFMTG